MRAVRAAMRILKAGALLLCVCMSAESCRAKPVSSAADSSISASEAVPRPNVVARDSASPQRKTGRPLPLTRQPLPSGLSWSFVTSSAAMPGGKFVFSIVVRNATGKTIPARLLGTISNGPIVEVTVADHRGVDVWSNVHGQDLPFSGLVMPIQPHDSLKVTVLWDGLDNSGRKLPPGNYSAEAYLIPLVRNQPSVRSTSERFQIR